MVPCSQCGTQLQAEWSLCPQCGQPVEQSKAAAEAATAAAVVPASSSPAHPAAPQPTQQAASGTQNSLGQQLQKLWAEASGPSTCPGCQTTSGPPGALCPHCGSRYPSPRTTLVGLGIGAVGALLLLIAYVTTGGLLEEHRRDSGSSVEGIGWLLAIVGGGIFIYSLGRSGPERQSSCCGCSCAVVVLGAPVLETYLWIKHGAAAAAMAVPLALPVMWMFDGALVAGQFAGRAAAAVGKAGYMRLRL